MKVRLLVREGAYKDREIPLPETLFLIGRGRECHLRPHCKAVSTLHCAVATWAGKVRVRDLQSLNGTFLNGRRIEGEVAVRDGDRLHVGSLVFEFRIIAEPGDILPAPVPSEGDLGWLLDAPGDSSVLSPARLTGVLDVEPDVTDAAAAEDGQASSPPPGETHPNPAISAGQHFRDYFALRRKAV